MMILDDVLFILMILLVSPKCLHVTSLRGRACYLNHLFQALDPALASSLATSSLVSSALIPSVSRHGVASHVALHGGPAHHGLCDFSSWVVLGPFRPIKPAHGFPCLCQSLFWLQFNKHFLQTKMASKHADICFFVQLHYHDGVAGANWFTARCPAFGLPHWRIPGRSGQMMADDGPLH